MRMHKQSRLKVLASRAVAWGSIMLCVWDFLEKKIGK